MNEVIWRIVASIVCATFFSLCGLKMLGAMQQSGYKTKPFFRWLGRKGNMFFNRICVLSLCLALTTAVFSLCFSFLGVFAAHACSAIPFFALLLLFLFADKKYALKVPAKRTGRYLRLFAVYYLFTACFCYLLIALLTFLAVWNGSTMYALIAFVPFAVLPVFLPFLLALANGIGGVFENLRNKAFVKKAGKTLNSTQILRVAVVGSYGKTSVKNILKTVLAEKYTVVETPASYKTPIGIAKTVFSEPFAGKQVLIAEMGARKQGDIKELCSLVKPDYAVFTGVVEQHVATFLSIENIFAEKSEIIKSGALTVCGEALKERVEAAFAGAENVCYAEKTQVQDVYLYATETEFTLVLGEKKVRVKTKLLGNAAVENILLAATLASKMGLTADEIARGIEKVKPIPHRLQLLESGGKYILDDGYNANPLGAKEAVAALCRFAGRKCVVTPGLVECGVLEEALNEELGKTLASANLDTVILVGDTLVGSVKTGYLSAGGDKEKLFIVPTFDGAKPLLAECVGAGDCVLFLNDLPDIY